MFNIPKLAPGGTMLERFPLGYIGEKEMLPAVKLKDKYLAIYKRTKKARIKKKAYKKSWTLYLMNRFENIKNITITIGDETKCIEV